MRVLHLLLPSQGLLLCFIFSLSMAAPRTPGFPFCDRSPCLWKWGQCSRSCGGGVQSPILVKPSGSCGICILPQAKRCNWFCCPRHCMWASWGAWGSCSATCGWGKRTRSRGFVTARCGGLPCYGSTLSSEHCFTGPVDCVWGPWSSFGLCSQRCGGGTRVRVRSIKTEASCGGQSCIGSTSDFRPCNTGCCPVDCKLGPWSSFDYCSATCDGGLQTRSRAIQTTSSCGGSICTEPLSESRECNTQCCAVNCIWGGWQEWSGCTKTCNSGLRTRTRTIAKVSTCGGEECTGESAEEETCNDVCCPVNCRLSDWSMWSSCDRECGLGTRTRNRTIDVVGSCGGTACEDLAEQSESCNQRCCPVDCQVSPWTPWSNCSTQCGPSGTSTRERFIQVQSSCEGLSCPDDLIENRPCNRFCFNGEIRSTECFCELGWRGTCCAEDVDECTEGSAACDPKALCENFDGGFLCLCPDGYTGDGYSCDNVDICVSGNHNCDPERARCINANGTFFCECLSGYTGDGVECEDIDECISGGLICHPNAVCGNFPGTFECACLEGYTGDGTQCANIDVCAPGNHNCDPQRARCIDIGGDFLCQCLNGYTGVGTDCRDFDECLEGASNCDPNALCVNFPGSFGCVCPDGYIGNGTQCTEIRQPPTPNVGVDPFSSCDPEKTRCNGNGNSFSECLPGYTRNGENCEDIDECESGVHKCNLQSASCTNTDGSYVCECFPGYIGDGKTCRKANSCSSPLVDCNVNATCFEALDSFDCACNPGFIGDGRDCADIDECSLNVNVCGGSSVCRNTIGGHTCVCVEPLEYRDGDCREIVPDPASIG
ncbi:SCO-spondin-like [Clavelina lepadiformis]|uniref:SCO-spondin-like n=1 Tax=Clavelina lepadiformis TaxID=159417 RepID=UPI00404291BC